VGNFNSGRTMEPPTAAVPWRRRPEPVIRRDSLTR